MNRPKTIADHIRSIIAHNTPHKAIRYLAAVYAIAGSAAAELEFVIAEAGPDAAVEWLADHRYIPAAD